MFILHAGGQDDDVKPLNGNITWSLPRSPTTTNMVRCCRATPFSIWTRMRLSIFFRTVAIVRLLPKTKLLSQFMLNKLPVGTYMRQYTSRKKLWRQTNSKNAPTYLQSLKSQDTVNKRLLYWHTFIIIVVCVEARKTWNVSLLARYHAVATLTWRRRHIKDPDGDVTIARPAGLRVSPTCAPSLSRGKSLVDIFHV